MELYCYLICQEGVNYRLAPAKGICHLPLRRLNPVLLQLLTFHMARRGIMKMYFVQRCRSELENLDYMHEFLEKCKEQKL